MIVKLRAARPVCVVVADELRFNGLGISSLLADVLILDSHTK